MYLAPDIFLIPEEDGETSILYAPLLGVAMHVSRGMAALVERLQKREGTQHDDMPGLEQLAAIGLVSRRPYPPLAPDSREERFDPTTASLFLTSRCNLGCTYCYANANETQKSMTWPLAKQALDLVLANAARTRRPVGVVLHGGGEATLEWDLLTRIVAYLRAEAEARNLPSRISIGTNGVLPEARARWLASHLDSATVSMDGPPDVHDRMRPTTGGGASHSIVLRTVRIFDELGFSYGLRMTVTREWVDRLSEAVETILRSCAVKEIQAEPVFPVGRASDSDDEVPDSQQFITAFRAAASIARRQGRVLAYSGARLGVVTDRFCEAAGRSFAVTPGGEVSSCYEISDPSDARADQFLWGRYDPGRDRFLLDEDRRKAQTRFGLHGKPHCASCFCKWHCAGDCSAKLAHLGDPTDTSRSPRCEINRALTRDQLVRAIRLGPEALQENVR